MTGCTTIYVRTNESRFWARSGGNRRRGDSETSRSRQRRRGCSPRWRTCERSGSRSCSSIQGINIKSLVCDADELSDVIIPDLIYTLHDLVSQDLKRNRVGEALEEEFNDFTHNERIASRAELQNTRLPLSDKFLDARTARQGTK